MPAPVHRRPPILLFAALVVIALGVSFAIGHLTGRWTVHRRYARFSFDPPSAVQQTKLGEHLISVSQVIRQDEYLDLRSAVERYREQAPSENWSVIDECLRVMQVCRDERAKQRPMVEYIAEGK